MSQLSLHCLVESQTCQWLSSQQTLHIDGPGTLRQQLWVSISEGWQCQLGLQLELAADSADYVSATDLGLQISRHQELLFVGQLNDLFQQSVSLGKLEGDGAEEYSLVFDPSLLLSSVVKSPGVNFTIWLELSCDRLEGVAAVPNQEQPVAVVTSDVAVGLASQAAVLGTAAAPSSAGLWWQGSLLLSLFALVFFVIIKFVHGKQQKKQTQAS